MIKLITVGKLKNKNIREIEKDYLKRISRYSKFEIIEVKSYSYKRVKESLKKEEEEILKKISDEEFLVLLDEKGKEYNSEGFAKFIENNVNLNKKFVFLIGSSNGVSDNIRRRADQIISFSKLTFPYQLFRVILIEQIYRGFKIINNQTYQK